MPETVEGGVYLVGKKYVDASGKEMKKSAVSEAGKASDESGTETAEASAAPASSTPYADALAKAGYDTDTKIRAASDEDLLAVEGIGPARLAEIRSALQS
jgi:DNA uptake protein ComE-like DNA-binding protein